CSIILSLWSLHAVLRARLMACGCNARWRRVRRTIGGTRVERAADDVVVHARKVFRPATANENGRVLREIVSLARHVGAHDHPVREPYPHDAPLGGVRLLRLHYMDARNDAANLRAPLERRSTALALSVAATAANELIDRRHSH